MRADAGNSSRHTGQLASSPSDPLFLLLIARRTEPTLDVPLGEGEENRRSFLEIALRAREEEAHAYGVVALGLQFHMRKVQLLASMK